MRRSEARATSAVKTYVKRTKMIPSPDPRDPPDLVHGLQLGTSPTRAGDQDDVSLNKLPQIRKYLWGPPRIFFAGVIPPIKDAGRAIKSRGGAYKVCVIES